jgi:hypothetical protein
VVKDQITFDDDLRLTARLDAVRRPDQIFGDIGKDASTDISRFGISQVDTSLILEGRTWRRSHVRAEVGYRSASFRDAGRLGDPAIGEVLGARGQSLPPAFETGYSALRAEVDVSLDTRAVAPRPMAGVAVRVFGGAHGAFEGEAAFNGWVRWGGSVGGFTDVLRDGRILSLQADVELISPVDGAVVPFTELIDIGDLGPLIGFLPGTIRGRSMAALTAAYEWPVWVFLHGRLFFAVGNAFDEYLEDFEAEDLRMSFGLGVEPTVGDGGELPFELSFALGTETFDDGADITSFRFFVGTRNAL